jgi:hypothetical protein
MYPQMKKPVGMLSINMQWRDNVRFEGTIVDVEF